VTNDTVRPASRRNQEHTVATLMVKLYDRDRLLSGLFATDVDAVSIRYDTVSIISRLLGFFTITFHFMHILFNKSNVTKSMT